MQNCDRLGHWQTPGGNRLSGSSERLGEHDMVSVGRLGPSSTGPTGLRGPGPEASGRPGIAESTERRRLMRLLPRRSQAAIPGVTGPGRAAGVGLGCQAPDDTSLSGPPRSTLYRVRRV